MCGRYYIDDEMAAEISRIIQNWDNRAEGRKEVFPTNTAPVIKAVGKHLEIDSPIWGFKHFDPKKSGVLINARAETVMERWMFKSSVTERRCIIPTAGFYEWDRNKAKIAFMHRESPVLYLAGFWKDDRFIILTTAPNNSIEDVHNRMPLTLERNELENWLFDPEAYKLILQKIPGALRRENVGQLL